MALEIEKYRIPLLDGTNYNNWKFRMETLLDELDLLRFVLTPYTSMVEFKPEDTAEQQRQKEKELSELRKSDRKCMSQIIQRIADSHLECAREKENSCILWNSLSATFERKGMASQLFLRKKLLTMKYDVNRDSLANHFLQFDRLVRDLKSTGAKLEENDVVCHLLLTMPAEYDALVTALETIPMEELRVSFVKNRLLDEETKRKTGDRKSKFEFGSTTVFSSQAGGKDTGSSKRSGRGEVNGASRNKFPCYKCGKFGHFRAQCKVKTHNQTRGHSAKAALKEREEHPLEDKHFCFSVSTGSNPENEIKWFLDSGATEHLVNASVQLKNKRVLGEPVKIKVAKSGTYLLAKTIGDVEVTNQTQGKEVVIRIEDVLCVSGLESNLLSVRKLEMNGFRVIFENGKGLIIKGNQVIATAYRDNTELYVLNFFQKLNSSPRCQMAKTMDLWHRRLGHLNYESMLKLRNKANGIEFEESDLSRERCETCIEGKQAKLPRNRTRIRAKRALELIHSDLMGPISPTSFDQKRYVLTFIDDFTHFTAAYMLESKSEVLKHFKTFVEMASSHFNTRASRFRCDNGREYISREIKEYFEEKGIVFEFTIRYTPEQNGVAERMNRTIMEKARCLLINCNLEKCFWTEAVRTAVYIINRSPTKALDGNIPATSWYGQKPNLQKLRVFGCVAYLLKPKELRQGKFESKSFKCYFTGYCPNGYRLWCPELKKIIYGKDVVFLENKFLLDGSFSEDWIPDGEKVDPVQFSPSDDRNNEEETYTEDDERGTTEEFPETTPVETPRRSTRRKARPRYLEDYAAFALNAESFVEDVPEDLEEIDSRDDREEWKKAIQEELDALLKNDTWTITTLPKGKKLISNKWVFKIKRDTDGNIKNYKARLVIKGCSQRKGFDYEETYAPVARLETFRTLLSIVNEEDLLLYQLDVKNAFLQGELKEDIYMNVPEGIETNKNLVCKLNKTLYGLKQAPRAWNQVFDKFVKELGLTQSEVDKCLYTASSPHHKVYLLLYVDDILIAGNNKDVVENMKLKLKERFPMKDLGEPENFLGINITRKDGTMFLSQPVYLRSLLEKFNMSECKPVGTPMEVKPQMGAVERSEVDRPYRELIGCLMYAMLGTRPDLSASVNFFSRYQNSQTDVLWKGLKRVLRYIKGTLDMGLRYIKGNCEPLTCYSDADWGSGEDRKSTSGYVITVYGNSVSWGTKRQTCVSLSSTEAEYVALATATTELLWMGNLLEDLKVKVDYPIRMFEDNQSCIQLLKRWEHRRLKHVDIKYNFIKDLYSRKVIEVCYIGSSEQTADILTKPLSKKQFTKLRNQLGVC